MEINKIIKYINKSGIKSMDNECYNNENYIDICELERGYKFINRLIFLKLFGISIFLKYK